MNSPAIVPLMLALDKTVYDSGQSEYFRDGYTESERLAALSGTNDEVLSHEDAYTKSIERMLQQRRFDLLILTNGQFPFAAQETIYQNYAPVRQISLYLPATRQRWEVYVMVPRSQLSYSRYREYLRDGRV